MPIPFVVPIAFTMLGLGTGCEPGYTYAGYDLPAHFPFDGSTREWEYNSDDGSVEWTLVVEKAESAIVGDVEVITVEHSNDDSGDLLYAVDWVSDTVEGVQIHGYTDFTNSNEVTFDPPILVAEKRGVTGDVAITQSGGYTWTSTFGGVGGCATFWVPGWEEEECLSFTLDDGDDSPLTNGIIVGTYTVVPRYGAAWLDLEGYDTMWNLSGHDWEE